MSDGDTITWESVVSLLTRERTRAETAARRLKHNANPTTVDQMSVVYGEAKARFDGVIAGLTVALARKIDPDALETLGAELQAALDASQQFGDDVNRLLPPTLEGHTKDNMLADAVEGLAKGVVGPIIEAITGIWTRLRDENALTRKTIETKLEAAIWPDYPDIK